ncbi:FecR family protein [Parasediminibacterium paludis]|uniref:FecR family protein n=1 Tax=Parasediminibacterium paludis TaxID=908966 RepID=A0ABV8PX38_9BACT
MKTLSEDLMLLIEREISGQASPEELVTLNNWLSADKKNIKEYQVLQQLYRGHQTLLRNNIVNTDEAWQKVSNKIEILQNSNKKTIIYRWYYVLSAAAAIFIIVFFAWVFRINNQVVTIEAVAGNEQFLLPDSSSVSLKKGSAITYNRSFKKGRSVIVKGIAYFDVKHIVSNSFTVITNNTLIQDIGTSFLVNNTITKDEITVFSGEIKCINLSTKAVINNIIAGKKIINYSKGFVVTDFTDTNILSWKSGVLDFPDVSLTRVLEDISLHYGITVKCLPIDLSNNIYVKLHFENQPIQEVLNEIKLVTKLQLRKGNNEFIFFQSVKNESSQIKKQK